MFIINIFTTGLQLLTSTRRAARKQQDIRQAIDRDFLAAYYTPVGDQKL
jgi:hypothetical protein